MVICVIAELSLIKALLDTLFAGKIRGLYRNRMINYRKTFQNPFSIREKKTKVSVGPGGIIHFPTL